MGSSGTPLKYYRQTPNTWNFEILIDGTGAIKKPSALDISLIGNTDPVKVEEEVKKLKALVLDYNGEMHRNPYLVVTWGEEVFRGTMESLEIGRASGRDRVCQYVSIAVVAVALKTKKK